MGLQTENRDERISLALTALDEVGLLRIRDLRRALERARFASSEFAELGCPEELIRATIAIAWCLCDLAQYEESHDTGMKALDLALAHQSDRGICAGYLQLGITACQAGDLLDSVEYLETSLEHARKLRDPLLSIRSLSNLANVYADLKEYDRAMRLMDEVFTLLARNDISINVNIVESNYGGFIVLKAISVFDEGNVDHARALAETALVVLVPVLERMREQGDQAGLPRCLNNCARSYGMLGDLERADALLIELLQHARKHRTDHTRGVYFHLSGFLSHIRGDDQSAARRYARAAKLFSRMNTKTLARLALLDAANAFERTSSYERAYFHLKHAHMLEQEQKMHEGSRRSQALNVKLAVEKARHENEMLRVRNELLNERTQELESKAVLDGLTGCLNRLGLEETLLDVLDRVAKDDASYYVAVLDVDHFKAVNDNFGHLIGDDVLRQVARIMKDVLRKSDTLGRFGGEEFLIIIEQETEQQAVAILNRVHTALQDFVWDSIAEGLLVTASIGYVPIRLGRPIADTLREADEHLYEAKRTGRNRIVGPSTPKRTSAAA